VINDSEAITIRELTALLKLLSSSRSSRSLELSGSRRKLLVYAIKVTLFHRFGVQ
jgi:hypothetical protein